MEFESKVIKSDSVADAIVTEAAFGGCDLVLLGTREIEAGRHRIGPVTDDVLKRVSCTAIATKYPAKPPKKILVPVILVLCDTRQGLHRESCTDRRAFSKTLRQ